MSLSLQKDGVSPARLITIWETEEIFQACALVWQSAPWECFWGQEMASGVERGRGGGSYGGEGQGGVIRCKKPGCFILFPLLWLLFSPLSSASVRFLFFSRFHSQGILQRSMLEMPAFFSWRASTDPSCNTDQGVYHVCECCGLFFKPRRVMKVMFNLSSGKCFWVVSVPHHCFAHSTTGRSGSPFMLWCGLARVDWSG